MQKHFRLLLVYSLSWQILHFRDCYMWLWLLL